MKRAALVLLLVFTASVARADFVQFQVPQTNLVVLLEVNNVGPAQAGRVTPIQHRYGTLWIPSDHVEKKWKTPSSRSLFTRQFATAQSRKDVPKLLELAGFALKRGLIGQFNRDGKFIPGEFHKAVDKLSEISPTTPEVRRVLALREKIDKPRPENPQLRMEMRKLVAKPGMEFAVSDHFLLYHDTPTKSPRGLTDAERRDWKPRSLQRLELLERVYQTFLYRFHSRGVELEIPKDRLKVVLFGEHKDYEAFATRLGPDMKSTAGFYEHTTNTAVFFDQGTHEQFKQLRKLEQLIGDLAKRDKGLINFHKTIKLLIQIDQESQDVEVVSHEATHQLAANTGLLPRYVQIPSWVHEGLATYFESPKDTTWAGFGAVNEQRIQLYRVLADRDREHANVGFIVGDQIFDYAGNIHSVLHGYAQAWALTHFLMERHFDKYMEFCRALGEMPPDVPLSAEVLTSVFREVFGKDLQQLDREWHAYMRTLKTDKELVIGDE